MFSAPIFAQLLTPPTISRTSLVAQMVKNLPAMWETQVWSLGWEVSLEKGLVIHLSILAWKIPWTEEPGRLQPMGSQRVRHYWATFTHLLTHSHSCHQDPHQSDAFTTINEPTSTPYFHSESLVCIRDHSWFCILCRFGKMYNDMKPSLWYHTAFSLP